MRYPVVPKREALPTVIGYDNLKELDRRLTDLVASCIACRKWPRIKVVNDCR